VYREQIVGTDEKVYFQLLSLVREFALHDAERHEKTRAFVLIDLGTLMFLDRVVNPSSMASSRATISGKRSMTRPRQRAWVVDHGTMRTWDAYDRAPVTGVR
jgi:hypothetical protein